jgi:integrase
MQVHKLKLPGMKNTNHFRKVSVLENRRSKGFPTEIQRGLCPATAATVEPFRTFYGLAAETGLRPGELCGLTLDDLDLQRGMLQVRQSAWRGKLGDPKTADSVRVVELSPQVCVHLQKYFLAWKPNEQRLLFATRNGTP